MDQCGQCLLSFNGCEFRLMMLQSSGDTAIEIRRCELDCMRGDDSGVKAIEPARFPVVPWSILDDGMLANTISPRLGKRAVRNLVHPNRTRCRAVHVERRPLPGPAPVGSRHRIAGALDLRKRREQFWRNHIRRVLLKDRSVLQPSLRRRFVQRAADWKEQFRWLANSLISPVESEP